MSSILKALKKIEESAPPEESLNPAQALNPRTVFGQRHRGRWLTSKIIYLGLAAVFVLAAGILIQGWMSGEADPRGGKPVTATADSAPADADAFRAKLPDKKSAAPAPPSRRRPSPAGPPPLRHPPRFRRMRRRRPLAKNRRPRPGRQTRRPRLAKRSA